MKKWNVIRILGLIAAVWLIVFGSLDNFLRTVKFGLEKFTKN